MCLCELCRDERATAALARLARLTAEANVKRMARNEIRNTILVCGLGIAFYFLNFR